MAITIKIKPPKISAYVFKHMPIFLPIKIPNKQSTKVISIIIKIQINTSVKDRYVKVIPTVKASIDVAIACANITKKDRLTFLGL